MASKHSAVEAPKKEKVSKRARKSDAPTVEQEKPEPPSKLSAPFSSLSGRFAQPFSSFPPTTTAQSRLPEPLAARATISERKAKTSSQQPSQAEPAIPSSESPEPKETTITQPATTTPSASFTQWYLQTITAQYANDLDKLRSAADFKENSSVAVLVGALKQGVDVFPVEERWG